MGYTALVVITLPVVLLALRLAIGSQRSEEMKPPTNLEITAAAEDKEYQLYSAALRRMVTALKNPDSFVLVNALKVKDGNLCITYRGTNSFNAIVTEAAVIGKDMAVRTDAKSWKKRCAGKSGERYTHIGYNL
ncbi:hypothetical protein IHQ71_26700 [Rhizobium sp. TH2]|uniref:hypothetical protein n=1 Tax=Rhizobium sp. TH2 TaxID=2775403 RepID=UPI0021582337|nr:hypothetical protein [Rhizobium sp. TH2]UVC08676.1 hypothetical protein IHQ71_26700 [Rhizobium sp. TH2]